MTGKVVRYLQDNGAPVEAGQPYVEVEAMKMMMPIKASESGKITHNLSPGSVISAGDLLASLELKDPSKVKKIQTFEGALDIAESTVDMDAQKAVSNVLSGYNLDAEAVAQQAFDKCDSAAAASDMILNAINEFYRVESQFDGRIADDVVRTLTKANAESLNVGEKNRGDITAFCTFETFCSHDNFSTQSGLREPRPPEPEAALQAHPGHDPSARCLPGSLRRGRP